MHKENPHPVHTKEGNQPFDQKRKKAEKHKTRAYIINNS